MKTCKWCNETKPLESFHKHKGMKDGRLNKCSSCVVKTVAKWRRANPDSRKEEHRRDAEKKGTKTREQWRKDVAENAIGRRASLAKYTHKRRIQTTTQCELTEFAVEELADLARLREQATGFKWHIDHTVPLNHKEACGLHTACNLQLVPADWNLRKGNSHMERWGNHGSD